MDVLFVIQLLGILYFVIGLALLLNSKYYKKMIEDYARSLPSIFLNGVLALLIGYWLIYTASYEVGNLPTTVSILGWLGLIKALYILLLPKSYTKLVTSFKLSTIQFEAWVSLLLGIIFLYYGFIA